MFNCLLFRNEHDETANPKQQSTANAHQPLQLLNTRTDPDKNEMIMAC